MEKCVVLKPTCASCADGFVVLKDIESAADLHAKFNNHVGQASCRKYEQYFIEPYMPEAAMGELKCHVFGGELEVVYAGITSSDLVEMAPDSHGQSRVYIPRNHYYTNLCSRDGICHTTEQDFLSQFSAWHAPHMYDAVQEVVKQVEAAVAAALSQHDAQGWLLYHRVDVFVMHPLLEDHKDQGGRELDIRGAPTIVVNELDCDGSASYYLDPHNPFCDDNRLATARPMWAPPLQALDRLYAGWRKVLVSSLCPPHVSRQACWGNVNWI